MLLSMYLIMITFFTGSPPSLPALLDLDVPHRIGASYEMFSMILLNDITGSQTEAIMENCRRKASNIVIRVLSEWLQGKGQSVSWETLIDTLRRIKHNQLADEIARYSSE